MDFYTRICRRIWPWKFAAGICRGNLPEDFAMGICRRNLPWLFSLIFFCICKQILFCICEQILFIWKQTFFYMWSRLFYFWNFCYKLSVAHYLALYTILHSNIRAFSSTNLLNTVINILSVTFYAIFIY